MEKTALVIVDVADEPEDALSVFENEAKRDIEALRRPHPMHHTAPQRPSLRILRVPRRTRDRWNSTDLALAAGLSLFACGVVVGAMLARPAPVSVNSPPAADGYVKAAPLATTISEVTGPPERGTAGSDVAQAVDTAGTPVSADRHAPLPGAAVPMHRGTLIVTSIPRGAAVFLNDEYAGQTPLTMRGVASGSRAVRVALDGYAVWSRGIQIVAGEATTVSAALSELSRAE